ncbi:MAG: hypothetical protein IH989_01850 [Planctomycetes bacterium]|nr:hypothetical protein [Planctomycetota bacterium]
MHLHLRLITPVLGFVLLGSASTWATDCNGNGIPDDQDIAAGTSADCNANGWPDECDIADGASEDCSGDGIPDECDSDCNENSLPDSCDILIGISIDSDLDGVPDECGKIYFSTLHERKDACPGSNRLRRMNPDGSNLESIAATTGYRTRLAVDLAAGKIYWNGWHFFGHIKRSNLDGSNEETLIPSDIFNAGPTTIALDLIDRKMYWTWTDYEAKTGKIQRANLDGTEVEDLVTGLGPLHEMAVDPFAKKVYWTDLPAKSILRADVNGSNVETVYTSTTTRAIYRFALDFCEQRIYFIRFGDLHRIDFEGSNYEYVADDFYLIALDLHRRRAYGGWSSILVSDLDGLNRESVGPDGPVGCIQGIAVDPGTGDCNGNGVDDACELAYGFGADCNSNDVLDDCDIIAGISEDCTGNGIPDECDIADGTENDCNGNRVPDECEPDCNNNGVADSCDIAGGTSEDCNLDGVPDECDLALGAGQDCNGNSVLDECEPDCNGNGVPNECDIADGTSVDINGDGVPDECQCPPSPLSREALPTPKNRFLTLSETNAGQQIARRVTFVDLPRPFDLWNGSEMWVGPTSVVSESGAAVAPVAGVANFNVARLQCTPHYADWNALGTVHVFHEGIVPGGIYRVDAIDAICDPGDPASFSATIGQTTAIWGDTLLDLSSVPPAPPEGVVNIVDALGVLGRFSSAPGAIIKVRADLEPACVDLKINVTDVLASLAGFMGLPYPFAPTATDPCDSTCTNPLP